MTLVDEIQLFSRDFINYKSFRTSKRKAKIREAYKLLTGESIKISCHTCYIEALFKIINSKKMATPNYQLKKGVLLQAFGDASKTCTNDTLTDELGKWYLENYPEKIIYFDRTPTNVVIPPAIKIIPPVKKEVKVEPETNTKLIADVLNSVSGIEPPVKIEPPKIVKKTFKHKK
jgi:hypothetical protein